MGKTLVIGGLLLAVAAAGVGAAVFLRSDAPGASGAEAQASARLPGEIGRHTV